MNLSKIAALYTTVGYPSLLSLVACKDFQKLERPNVIAWRVSRALDDMAGNAGMVGPDGFTYGVSINNIDDETTRFDAQGERIYDELRVSLSLRAYQWASAQVVEPEDFKAAAQAVRAAGQQAHAIHLMAYPPKNSAAKAVGKLNFAAEADLAVLVRGCRAFQRKRDKAVNKVVAQLAVYHREQELQQLRRGHWLGAEKALTTTPRVNEAGVPFLGDVAPTPEQRIGLHYWAVPADAGMSMAFPAGTGIALREVTSARQLVDGAVYLSQVTFGQPGDAHYCPLMRLGRLDMARKRYGMVPLFADDAPERDLHIQAEWKKKEGAGYEVKLLQVVYYTTRAEQLALALKPASTPPLLRVQGREPSFAQAA
jgi:hypothetical protein